MDLKSPILHSDDESDSDALLLDTDYDDLSTIEDSSTATVNINIGTIWRDIVVGDEIEGSLTRLEVTTKKTSYTDVDDPNYMPMNNQQKRKRIFSSSQKTENASEDETYDLESNHVVKKRFSNSKGNFSKCKYKYGNTKEFIEKRDNINHKTKCRILPNISDSEEMAIDQFVEKLCINLHEHNKVLMLSVISKIDKSIILEKYNKTCLIEANGGQMIKNGNRRRTSGGIFFSLIKEDKTIPNSAKKELFICRESVELKKKKKRERIQRKKEKLKKIIAQDKKKAEALNGTTEDLGME